MEKKTVKEYSKILKNMKFYPDIIEYAFSLKREEQKKFVEAFAKTGKYALSNMGYFSGYFDRKKMLKIQKVFNTEHPIFGKKVPTAEEAFNAGMKLAEASKRSKQ